MLRTAAVGRKERRYGTERLRRSLSDIQIGNTLRLALRSESSATGRDGMRGSRSVCARFVKKQRFLWLGRQLISGASQQQNTGFNQSEGHLVVREVWLVVTGDMEAGWI